VSVDEYIEQFIATFYIYFSPSTYDFCKLDLSLFLLKTAFLDLMRGVHLSYTWKLPVPN